MKAATISELKQELSSINVSQLRELCLRLAKFKKENKELLTYLLFEAHDTTAYIQSVKVEMESQLAVMNRTSVYLMKKTLRKVLRTAAKYTRYSGLPVVEIELLIYFCEEMQKLNLPLDRNPVLSNLYHNQVKKIKQSLESLHEDLQYEYRKSVEAL